MSFDLTGRLYKIDNRVYFGYNQLNVHNQRGRLFVKHFGRQINLKEIPVLPEEKDCVFDYIFGGLFRRFPCVAMDFWIYRWRLGNKISTFDYVKKFNKNDKNVLFGAL